MEAGRDMNMTVQNGIVGECMRKEKAAEREKPLKGLRQLLREEEGMGTVEVILIIVVLVGLVLIFKSQITTLVGSLFQKITSQANGI